MILDLDRMEGGGDLKCQCLVIGAGAVGILLATELAGNGIDVVLLETGGVQLEGAAQDLNNALVVGRPHLGISQGRARILGGTTTLWGGQLVPFSAMDFKKRDWVPLSGWPIDRDELQPFYEAVADRLDLALKGAEDSAIWSGVKMTRPELGGGLEVILTRWLRETNFSRHFSRELKGTPSLRTVLHATASDMNFDVSSGRITRVTARSLKGRELRVEADKVVLACGTVEASRLMLAIARKNPTVPWASNTWTGAAFQDHLALRAARVHPIDSRKFGDAFDNIYLRKYKYNPKIYLREEFQERHRLVNIAASFAFDSSLKEHLSNIKIFLRALARGSIPPDIASIPKHILALVRVWWPLVKRYIKDRRAFNPSDRGIHLILHCEQVPLKDSRVTLDDSRLDANGVPLARMDWQVDGREIETMAVFCEQIRDRLKHCGLAELEIDQRLLARNPNVMSDCYDTNHQCGGLRMADTPEAGVVGSDLKVFGTENLYAAGAMVFPSSSFANPTYTAMALALRLTKHLTGMLNEQH